MFLSYKSIPLNDIKLIDTWNLHPWENNNYERSKELEISLSEIGVLHAPIIIRSGSSFIPLAGYKRLQFYKSSAQAKTSDQVVCLAISDNAPAELLLDIVLCDQQTVSPLSIAEKGRFIAIASKYLSENEIINKYFDRLELKNRPSTFRMLERLLQQHEIIIKEVHRDRLNENMLLNILQLKNANDRVKLVSLFKTLNIGAGKQKKFYTLIRDASGQSQSTISEYLDREEIIAILEHKEMNTPQKTNNLGKLIEQSLSPDFTQAEKEFTKVVKSLEIPSNYNIAHSPSFEKDEVTLSITFKSLAQCSKHIVTNQLVSDKQTKGSIEK